MKQISVREFQLHAAKYLKELPIVLTQYGKPIAKVLTQEESVNKPLPLITSVAAKDEIIFVPEKNIQSNVPKKNQKKVDKKGYCPHFINADGYCAKCGS